MKEFIFSLPTTVYFGPFNNNDQFKTVLKEHQIKRLVIVVGQGSVKKIGILDQVTKILDELKVKYLVLEGVRPNPTRQLADNFVEQTKKFKPDYLLAIGGGSVMDTAKYIAVGYYHDGNTFDFNLHQKSPTKAIPIGVILTISASGSEMSTSCVIQDDETKEKKGFNNPLIVPKFAFEDPRFTFGVSRYQTGCGIVDIMMHTLERYLRPSDSDYELADEFALGLLKTVYEAGKAVSKNPHDEQARANLMLASSFSHNGLTSIGKKSFMPVHQLGHALSGAYPEVAHGAGLSILFLSWANYFVDILQHKLAKLGRALFKIKGKNELKAAKQCLQHLKEFYQDIGMPVYFEDLQGTNVELSVLVETLFQDGRESIDQGELLITKEIAQKIYQNSYKN